MSEKNSGDYYTSVVEETIGTYVLTEQTDFDVPQEYAGATQIVTVPAGEYPVQISCYRGRRYISIPLSGMLTYSSFWNRIGSVGSLVKEQPNTPRVHHLRPYCYELASMAATGKVRLTEPYGWESEVVDHDYPMSWQFAYEDDGEIVALPERPFGPFKTKDDALWHLNAEFGATRPEDLCYKLVGVRQWLTKDGEQIVVH